MRESSYSCSGHYRQQSLRSSHRYAKSERLLWADSVISTYAKAVSRPASVTNGRVKEWCDPARVAADFIKFDCHTVQLIQRHIELLRYRRFGDDLLLELAYANNGTLEKRTPKSVEVVALADNSTTTPTPLRPNHRGQTRALQKLKPACQSPCCKP